LSGAQDSQRTKDAVATTAAVIIFWPAAFLVGGDKQTAAELEWDWRDISAHLRCTRCGTVGYVDMRVDWSEVINFNNGIG
jgi:hypothetical protein